MLPLAAIAALALLALVLVVAAHRNQRATDRERQELITAHRADMLRQERAYTARMTDAEKAREAELHRLLDRFEAERQSLLDRVQAPVAAQVASATRLVPPPPVPEPEAPVYVPVTDDDLKLDGLLA